MGGRELFTAWIVVFLATLAIAIMAARECCTGITAEDLRKADERNQAGSSMSGIGNH